MSNWQDELLSPGEGEIRRERGPIGHVAGGLEDARTARRSVRDSNNILLVL